MSVQYSFLKPLPRGWKYAWDILPNSVWVTPITGPHAGKVMGDYSHMANELGFILPPTFAGYSLIGRKEVWKRTGFCRYVKYADVRIQSKRIRIVTEFKHIPPAVIRNLERLIIGLAKD